MKQIVHVQMTNEVFESLTSEDRNKFNDWQREPDDYEMLKEDETFCKLYSEYRKVRKKLNDYKFELRKRNGIT